MENSLGFPGENNFSEQDWQKYALKHLGEVMRDTYNIKIAPEGTNQGNVADDFVGVFYLSTANLPNAPPASRAWVVNHLGATRVFNRDLDGEVRTEEPPSSTSSIPKATVTAFSTITHPATVPIAPTASAAAVTPQATPLWRWNVIKQ